MRSFDWFDKERKNKKHASLKRSTVEFVFENDGTFTPDRGRTLPPTKDTGWYTAMAMDDAGPDEVDAAPPTYREDGLHEEEEDSDDSEDDDPEVHRQPASSPGPVHPVLLGRKRTRRGKRPSRRR